MFRASGSFGASFYVEDTRRGINSTSAGRPKPRKTNTVVRKTNGQPLNVTLRNEDKALEKKIAQMKKEKEALNRKIEKEEEARIARMKKEKEELNRNIKKEEEERKKIIRQIRPKQTHSQGVKGKKQEINVSRKIIREENILIRRYN